MAAAGDGILEELLRGGGGGGGMGNFFPIIVGVLGPPAGTEGPDRVVLVNPLTQGMVVLEGDAGHLSDILADVGAAGKRGPPPASKASIEAMRTVEVGEGDLSEQECAVCLDGFKSSGGVVKEMPCRHMFHGGCIEKWLGMHGSCPVCRYQMPVEEEDGARKGGEREGVGEGTVMRREIWMTIAFGVGDGTDRQRGEEGRADGGDEGEQQL
ncbi:E3 ubiquitin-protein ligase MPSR1 [Elaeis guineensis]|uniref:RING-type E3 ubiquitin transferase n=1 Tax=Elaeis guineensis var. tenera TaxID=51953 RepID=A0A6I9RGX2_ELAGV|nr:E3 ubiquitin-protein ligase MPSR1 [Elaeis guineensis]